VAKRTHTNASTAGKLNRALVDAAVVIQKSIKKPVKRK
jgi:hypothetical protein